MRYFLDTEFIDSASSTVLISIALVCEDGREYYAWSSEGWQPSDCDEWLQKNVLVHMPDAEFYPDKWKTHAELAKEICMFMPPESKPQIWAYFADYDWVLFSKLFGRMLNLPQGYPHLCMDLKQLMLHLNIDKNTLPTQIGVEHDALNDARWVRDALNAIIDGAGRVYHNSNYKY